MNTTKLTCLKNQFLRYFLVGIVNTSVSWAIFFLVLQLCALQTVAITVAFIITVLLSYVLNSWFTFKQSFTGKKFVLFTAFMGIINVCAGFVADTFTIFPLFTVLFVSSFSLIIGFLASKFLIFRA